MATAAATSNTSAATGAARSRRSIENAAYAARALACLDRDDPALAWLFPGGRTRPTVLTELGRLAARDGDDACRHIAHALCRRQPPTTWGGALLIRRHRLGHDDREAPPGELERRIHLLVEAFLGEYPGTSAAVVETDLVAAGARWGTGS